jgi:ATP-binding cassette subfamily F protein uup
MGETVRVAAIDQLRTALDPEATVVQEIAGPSDHVKVGERSVRVEPFLDGFLFPGDRKHTQVKRLSGGERNRVLLAKLLLRGGNVLVLDEPTNDLDLPALRALEEALLAFEGTVVVVSHDRWFLDRIATEIVHLDGRGGCVKWGAGLSSLLERVAADRLEEERRAAAAAAPAASAPPPSAPAARAPKPRRLSNKEEAELAALPSRIETLEARVEELTQRLGDPSLYAGPVSERSRVQTEHEAAADEVAVLYKRWEELESRRSGG